MYKLSRRHQCVLCAGDAKWPPLKLCLSIKGRPETAMDKTYASDYYGVPPKFHS